MHNNRFICRCRRRRLGIWKVLDPRRYRVENVKNLIKNIKESQGLRSERFDMKVKIYHKSFSFANQSLSYQGQ
jgi:hypothetical protein